MMISGSCKKNGSGPIALLVIEDSLVGVKAGKAAGVKVVAVPSLQIESDSYSIADSTLHSLLEFQPEQWGLPQFGDWVDNTLPIEPIHLAGVFRNGLLQTYADNELPALPDQIWGLYIGWAKFDGPKVFKAVISIGWSVCGCNSKRKIRPCILNESDADKDDSKMQLLLMGYLRRSCSAGNILNNLDILDEDKLTAVAALNLPAYSHQSCTSFFV
ncbi:UNVERIFIED_CONTAM: Bifunctional riboflavin kinase/FMN phosphatase [Sesamum angustifolium]|uniref:riboflavin kinase n=1 Tax=Sesamum angustifolium TaxID=2727405 RepID=A0AAW2PGF0_9LAMI